MPDGRRAVVIGSGPAGAMAAHELVRRGIPTVMLESGTRPPRGALVRVAGRNVFRLDDQIVPSDDFEATGDPETRWMFNLALGGLSNQWTGAVPRFAPEDFTEGERLDERYRWPLDYDDLARFYAEAERHLEVTASPGDLPALPAGVAAHVRHLPADWRLVARTALDHGQGLTVRRWPTARRGWWRAAARRSTASARSCNGFTARNSSSCGPAPTP